MTRNNIKKRKHEIIKLFTKRKNTFKNPRKSKRGEQEISLGKPCIFKNITNKKQEQTVTLTPSLRFQDFVGRRFWDYLQKTRPA